jgi:hypothetical protein
LGGSGTVEKFCPLFGARASMRTPDERPLHRTDHLQRHVAAIGTGDSFSKGRDFAAWLGLVPRQISTGDRTILGKISKRGNRYLRVLLVQAAWVVLVTVKPTRWEGLGLRPWIEAAKKRLHYNVLAIALPTSSRASRGAFLLMVEPSRRTSFRLLRDLLRVIELPARRGLREDETRWSSRRMRTLVTQMAQLRPVR